MATKYWYKAANGSDNWSVASNWYLGSGGSGGATTVPTSVDDVILDANSGSGTITVAALTQLRSLVATGFTGTLAGSSGLQITGSNSGSQGSGVTILLGSGMTYSFSGTYTLSSGNGSGSINFNGKTHLTGNFLINGATGIWSLAGNFATTGSLTLSTGSFSTNNYNVTCNLFQGIGALTRTLNLGSSIFTCTSSIGSFWAATTTGLTFNPGTSTIRHSVTSASTTSTFNGGGLTYYNLEFVRGAATGSILINGSNTFFNFINNTSTAAHTLSFQAGTTQTFQNFNVVGASPTNRLVFSVASGVVNFVKTGSGAVFCDNLNIGSNVTSVSPANTWYAGYNSIGTGTGWVFRNPGAMLMFGVGS